MNGTSRSSARSSKVWLVALPAGALIVALGLWSIARGGDGDTAGRGGDSELAALAVQDSDLPPKFQKCDFSGDMESYLRTLRRENRDTYESVQQTWSRLRRAGATAGYVAFYGDSQDACNSVLGGGDGPHGRGGDGGMGGMPHTEEETAQHLSVVFSMVFKFEDTSSAVSAYEANIFGQAGLKSRDGIEVRTGEPTGLGPNSTVAVAPATVPLHQAVWQRNSFDVLYGSENLPIDRSRQVTAAVDGLPG